MQWIYAEFGMSFTAAAMAPAAAATVQPIGSWVLYGPAIVRPAGIFLVDSLPSHLCCCVSAYVPYICQVVSLAWMQED